MFIIDIITKNIMRYVLKIEVFMVRFRKFLILFISIIFVSSFISYSHAMGDMEYIVSQSVNDIMEEQTSDLNSSVNSRVKSNKYEEILNNRYIIHYDANGGEGEMVDNKVSLDADVKLFKNEFTREGYTFVGWCLEDKKDEVNMTHFQYGEVAYENEATVKNLGKRTETVTLYACWKGSGGKAAADWGKLISEDDSFTYGVKPMASRCGCYFCGTNDRKFRAAKGTKWEGDPRWEKTYVCTTFVNACLAHGANDANCYDSCSKGRSYVSGAPKISEMDAKDGFVKLGKPAKSKLQPGDILIMNRKHAALYCGDGYYVEAAGGNWSPKSIIYHELKDGTYSRYDVVYRLNQM